MGVAGIARDLEAAGLGQVKKVEIKAPEASRENPVDVLLEFGDTPSLCPAFGLRHVANVKNGPSPKWMQQRLLAIGMRPISALVDITNYVTYDLGRPLHVFDADKVAGNLVVRRGQAGEKFVGLDEKEYEVNAENCVISDDNGIESLGGIMGGLESGCSMETTNVLVESALWEPLNIARTGRALGINTDARYRFERGVDPAFMVPGLDHATHLVMELCGGEPSKAVISGEVPEPNLVIEFDCSEVDRLTGVAVSAADCANILKKPWDYEVAGRWRTSDRNGAKLAS